MGENKKIKRVLDFTCMYCGKKYNLAELQDQGYIEYTKCGIVVLCPNVKCETEQLI